MNDKKLVLSLAALLMGISLPMSALGQELGPEDSISVPIPPQVVLAEEEEDVEDPDLVWDFRLTSEMHSSDNASFRELDETQGNIEIRETDDRHTFMFTSVSASVRYRLLEDTTFRFSASHSGMWGGRQIGGTDAFGGFVSIHNLSVDWRAVDSPNFTLNVRLGRQPYEIGGAPRDYFLRDVLDGLVVETGFGPTAGKLRILAFDLFASQGRPDSVNFLAWHGGDNLNMNLRGDTNTMRFGGVYENTGLVDGLELRAFGFYAHIGGAGSGAAGTGSDRTREGTLGNFADNDYVWMAGTRLGYSLPLGAHKIGAMAEYARAGGLDRKEVNEGAHDVVIEGNAFGGALTANFLFGQLELDTTFQYFHADGASYGGEDGLQFSHGFVSFKGGYAGGLAMGRYAGWRPSSYLDTRGIRHAEHDQRRGAGTQILHAGIGVGLVDSLGLDLGLWHYTDTGLSNVDFETEGRAADIGSRMPFGYSQDDVEAQERLGRDLGLELGATLTYKANTALSLYTGFGIFIPGSFYEIEVTRKAGSARGSDDLQDFWAVTGGASVVF